ncbi:hypothetical protein RHSIM_Rhsim08G0187500 [Rhododendron simsii]|uniref:Uncharacterized protein n=1 Tax=Rhododendron simsii TaxID=118357 RepID=A0A834GKF1_RHOSS|nr:hypothetical protein RHSIM_Rhsim08G0187500 [Rhododendron simsii]
MAENDEHWVIKVEDELEQMASSDTIQTAETQHWEKRSIYRVPACVTDLNKKAYRPQAVSFGPYHHGEDNLVPMEEHKRRALLHFLKRSGKPLKSYVDSLAGVAQSLKDSYESLDPAWGRDTGRFLQLMILDGCFMLEVLRTATQATDDYAHNDPIFSDHGKFHIVPYIQRDMLMLENQLPMLLLTTLLAVENEKIKEDDEFVNKLILKFCRPNTRFPLGSGMGKCLHVLDVYRKSLLWKDTSKKKSHHHRIPHISTGREGGDEIIPCAMELDDAGIRFKRNKSGSLKDISFKGGVLRLPLIMVDDSTESMFLNLIAFERFHVGAGNAVTSYIFFMDNIIDSAKDVSLLHARGIIQNAIGSDKAVAKLFNSLSKDVTLDPDSNLDVVHKRVNKYCKKRWNVWRANLIHTYFRNPWAILSVIAAVFLFALTIAQTIYTIYPYYHSNDSPTPSPPPPPSH